MINSLQSVFKINDHVTIFNIEISGDQESNFEHLIEPISEILYSHPRNSLYLYSSGGLFYAEALICIGEKYGVSNSVGRSIEDTIEKLIPKLIESTSSINLYPRNKQLVMGDNYEVTSE
ncbi:hypothetical protein [Halobacteriovorax sp.]|uniref:hypothetical protein n=1 Tax=Halobacteriovorax sp. TaxID=2020862 RepID=UPI0035616529